jgi:hypothetical protein
MKSTNFLAIAIIAVASVTGQLVAQETSEIQKSKTKSNNTNERSATWDIGQMRTSLKIIPTETGCDIVSWSWGASNSSNSSGGEIEVGKFVSKVSSKGGEDGSITQNEIIDSRKQISVTNEEENSTEVAKNVAAGKHFKEATISMKSSGGVSGAEKVSMQDFHFTVKCKGRAIPATVDNDTCTFPEDLPDGAYDVVCSWSWGAHQTGTFTQKTIDCHLKIENGVCVGMAINEK